MESLAALALGQFADRDSGPAGYDPADLVLRHTVVNKGNVLHLVLFFCQLLFECRKSAVLQFGRLVQVALLLRFLDIAVHLVDLLADSGQLVHAGFLILPLRFLGSELLLEFREFLLKVLKALHAQFIIFFLKRGLLDLQLQDLPLHLIEFCGKGVHLSLDQRAGLVHQVDCFIRQESVGDVSVGKNRRAHKRVIHDLDAVIHFIAFLESSQDRDRVLNSRFIYHDGLESSLESRVLLDVLSVFLEGCRADAVQLAPCKHGFKHISGVHCAFRFACAHNSVKLVDKENDLAFALAHILQHGFESLFKLTSVFCPRYQGAHIEGEYLLVLEAFRHIALGNTLRKSFYDRGLTYAGLTDQNRVVLGLSGQDADHIPDLRVSADNRIKFLISCLSDEFLAVLSQSVIGRFGVICCNSLIASHC